jgi:cell division septum initiation protein DivIVA
VDVFLDLVGAELARLIETNNDLREKIERLG